MTDSVSEGFDAGQPPKHWLDTSRLRVYAFVALAGYLIAAFGMILASDNALDANGKPLGYDFITFWGASLLALEGNALAAFDALTIHSAQSQAVPGLKAMFLWHYPPTFMLVALPLATLPYFISYGLWTLGGLTAYGWTIWRIAPHRLALMLALASTATFLAVFHGQNSLLTTALLGGALLLLTEKRQFAAGILIGLLAFKPHLGVLIPLALIAAGQWRAFSAAALTSGAFVALSTALFGFEYWTAFIDNLPLLRRVLEEGMIPWGKMPTPFATLMVLGAPLKIAYGVQTLSALMAAMVITWSWYRRGVTRANAALLIAATCLVSPYLFDYDMALLSAAVAFLAWDGIKSGHWIKWEREAYLAVAVLPALMGGLYEITGLQTGLLGPLAVMFYAYKRAHSPSTSTGQTRA